MWSAHPGRCRLPLIAGVILGALVSSPGSGRAYEFEVNARTIGQGYRLRSFRLLGSDLVLGRSRFTQTLSLNLWDLGGHRKLLSLHEPEPGGPRYYFSGYLRVDHDFGDWTVGELLYDGRMFDAVDLVPELEASSLTLDLLYGYFAAEDLFGGLLDVRVGRQLSVDALDWWNMDGVSARVTTPWRMAVEGFGGLRVRDSSPLGAVAHELDGTSSAECAEYVEGAAPGSGSWRPIDRAVPGSTNPFTNDFDLCPQRDELAPTFGGAIETEAMGPLFARISYRRTLSRTVGLIGPSNRFEFEDLGLYPDEAGQAPKWGINEERVAASVRSQLGFANRRGRLTSYAGMRYSLLHGLVDEGHAGFRVGYGAHSAEAEIYYSFPTFDGDSIFNVFSAEPYTDYRVTYDLKPRATRWRTYLRGWLRRYRSEDADEAVGTVAASELASGVQAGARYQARRNLLGRVDLFHEDGYGGRRSGGYGAARWRLSRSVGLSGRLSMIDFDSDASLSRHGLTVSADGGLSYVVNPEGVTLHLLVEESINRYYDDQFRVIAIVDLAFQPEI